MIIVLLVILLMLFVTHILMFKVDWMSPTILSLFSYIISISVLLINHKNWNINISGLTFIVIVVGFIFLSLGELTARNLVFTSNIHKKNVQDKVFSKIEPSKILTNLIIIFMSLTTMFYYFFIRRTVSYVDISSVDTLLGTFRSLDNIQMNPFLRLAIVMTLPIAYYYLYIFIQNIYFYGKSDRKIIIPILLYSVIELLSSARIGILYLIFITIAFSIILYQEKTGWMLKVNFKMILRIIFLMSFAIIIFYLFGFLTGKSNQNNFYYSISLYVGSPVAALSEYLDTFNYSFEKFGEETLIGFNNIIEMFGIELKIGSASRNHEFIRLGDMPTRTNIYTSFRSVLNDYGYLGMIIYQFLVGFILSHFYEKIKINHTHKKHGMIVIYAFVIRFLFFQFTNERLLINLLTSTTLVQIIILIFLVRVSNINNNDKGFFYKKRNDGNSINED